MRRRPSRIVRAELERHDWAALRCGCGRSGTHLPAMLGRYAAAETYAEVSDHALDGHVVDDWNLFEVAVPAVGVILATLAGDVERAVREYLTTVLWHIVCSDSPLAEECRVLAREGIWLLARYAVEHGDHAALDVLEVIDPDRGRYEFFAARVDGT